jgi:hypothetical protein
MPCCYSRCNILVICGIHDIVKNNGQLNQWSNWQNLFIFINQNVQWPFFKKKKKNSQWLDSKQLGKNDTLVKLDKRTKNQEKTNLLIFSIKKAMISYNAYFQSWILSMYQTHQLIFSITWFVIMRNYVDSFVFNMFQLMIRLLDLFLPRLYLSISFSIFVLFSLLVLRMINE